MTAYADVNFDEKGEFLIFPQVRVGFGIVDVNLPERLQWDGRSVVALGEKVLTCLALSETAPPPAEGEPPAFQQATGAKTFRAFSKTRQKVAVESKDGQITIEFWRRDANYIYAAFKTDPADWTVVLPVDAPPEAVGAAVVGVLQAGGIPIENTTPQSPVTTPDTPVPDDAGGDLTYDQFKSNLLVDYYHLLDAGSEPMIMVIGRLLDEVMYVMAENPDLYVCVITTTATLCLQEGFLPDYLDYPVHHLDDLTSRLTGAGLACYRNDTATLNTLLTRSQYTIVAPEYPPDSFDGWENWVKNHPTGENPH